MSPFRPNLGPGYRLDRYELLCPIAQGGMAEVWVARLHGKFGFEKTVAVKMILPQYAEDPAFRTMFLDEAQIAVGVADEHVAQVLDLGEQAGLLYLVMEWVDGDSLARLHGAVTARGESLPLAITLHVVSEICAGLHTVHSLRDKSGRALNVIHRDVSPQNVLLNTHGVAKIIDFGLAKARERRAADTQSGVLKGKLRYMPPEQMIAGAEIDRRADVFAVGAVLYHLLAGKPPYDAETDVAVVQNIIGGKRPDPLPESTPEPLRAIVWRALERSPDERFATIADLKHAIDEFIASRALAITSEHVAEYMSDHLGERAAARRAAIEEAESAANHHAARSPAVEPSLSAMAPSAVVTVEELLAKVREAVGPTSADLDSVAGASEPLRASRPPPPPRSRPSSPPPNRLSTPPPRSLTPSVHSSVRPATLPDVPAVVAEGHARRGAWQPIWVGTAVLVLSLGVVSALARNSTRSRAEAASTTPAVSSIAPGSGSTVSTAPAASAASAASAVPLPSSPEAAAAPSAAQVAAVLAPTARPSVTSVTSVTSTTSASTTITVTSASAPPTPVPTAVPAPAKSAMPDDDNDGF